jgi:hypothetical protein
MNDGQWNSQASQTLQATVKRLEKSWMWDPRLSNEIGELTVVRSTRFKSRFKVEFGGRAEIEEPYYLEV